MEGRAGEMFMFTLCNGGGGVCVCVVLFLTLLHPESPPPGPHPGRGEAQHQSISGQRLSDAVERRLHGVLQPGPGSDLGCETQGRAAAVGDVGMGREGLAEPTCQHRGLLLCLKMSPDLHRAATLGKIRPEVTRQM